MCQRVKLPGGDEVMVCGGHARSRFCVCGREAGFECDWIVRRNGNKPVTCDRAICAKHATVVAPDKHVCPQHLREFDRWKRRHPDFDPRRGEQISLFGEAA